MKDQIKYRFNEAKATQVAAWLLKRRQGTLPYLALMKLLYLAERESFRANGRPIVGDLYVSMNKGPVLSNLLNLITGEGGAFTPRAGIWDRFIKKTSEVDVALQDDPGAGNLSESETALLDEVSDACEGMSKWDLVELTHGLPEWKNPNGSRLQIPVEEILRQVGKSEEQIDRIRAEAAEDYFLGSVLNS
jgi:uncharacterized phage-associated protein